MQRKLRLFQLCTGEIIKKFPVKLKFEIDRLTINDKPSLSLRDLLKIFPSFRWKKSFLRKPKRVKTSGIQVDDAKV